MRINKSLWCHDWTLYKYSKPLAFLFIVALYYHDKNYKILTKLAGSIWRWNLTESQKFHMSPEFPLTVNLWYSERGYKQVEKFNPKPRPESQQHNGKKGQ